MSEILPPWPMLGAFLAASFVLAVTPGPGVFYIVTRSLTQGRSSGLASVGGVALGNLGNALGASIGLATLFAVSSLAFTVVKYAGAMYLVVLGIRTLRSAGQAPHAPGLVRHDTPAQIFRDGFYVALLNPKTAIFFAAFLPQFMTPGPQPLLQTAALGTLFIATAACTDTIYALSAGALAPRLSRRSGKGMIGRYLAGGVYIGLGALTAFAGNRNK